MRSSKETQHLAIFASGGGSNAESIIRHFKEDPLVNVRLIVTNKADAYVLKRAEEHNIESIVITKEEMASPEKFIAELKAHNIDLIALAGFLLLIPPALIAAFPDKILNIHPSLLPKYGGPGMYGKRVHQAVFDNNERESGMTIHYVNEKYDEGKIVFQDKVSLEVMDTPEIIAKKVLELEHKNYGKVIKDILN